MTKALAPLAILTFLVSVVVIGEILYAASIRPTGVQTLADHLNRFGNPRLIYRVTDNGGTFYELQGFPGGARPLLAFPSSPPAYVYDANGRLIDWCADPGDHPTHSRKWPRLSNTPIRIQDFREQFNL